MGTNLDDNEMFMLG